MEPGRSRWQRRVWAGFKNGPLFFQVRQVKELGYSWETSLLQVDLAGEAVGLWLAFVGVWWGSHWIRLHVSFGLPLCVRDHDQVTHSTVAWRVAFSLCHDRYTFKRYKLIKGGILILAWGRNLPGQALYCMVGWWTLARHWLRVCLCEPARQSPGGRICSWKMSCSCS